MKLASVIDIMIKEYGFQASYVPPCPPPLSNTTTLTSFGTVRERAYKQKFKEWQWFKKTQAGIPFPSISFMHSTPHLHSRSTKKSKKESEKVTFLVNFLCVFLALVSSLHSAIPVYRISSRAQCRPWTTPRTITLPDHLLTNVIITSTLRTISTITTITNTNSSSSSSSSSTTFTGSLTSGARAV